MHHHPSHPHPHVHSRRDFLRRAAAGSAIVTLLQACAGVDPRDHLALLDDAAERERRKVRLVWQVWTEDRNPVLSFVIGEDGAVEARHKLPLSRAPLIQAVLGTAPKAKPRSAAGRLSEVEWAELERRLARLSPMSYREPSPRKRRLEDPPGVIEGVGPGPQSILLVRDPSGSERLFTCFAEGVREEGDPPYPPFRADLIHLTTFFSSVWGRLEDPVR